MRLLNIETTLRIRSEGGSIFFVKKKTYETKFNWAVCIQIKIQNDIGKVEVENNLGDNCELRTEKINVELQYFIEKYCTDKVK